LSPDKSTQLKKDVELTIDGQLSMTDETWVEEVEHGRNIPEAETAVQEHDE